MNFDGHWQSKRVNNNMFFLDLLAAINAIFTAVYMMRSPDTPGIYKSTTANILELVTGTTLTESPAKENQVTLQPRHALPQQFRTSRVA